MSRNVEDLFGGTIEAIQQEIGGFNAVGGETGFDVKKNFKNISIFLDSAYQDPDTAFTVDGSVITLAEVLNPGVRVSYILNANWNSNAPNTNPSGYQIINYFYTVVGGEKTIVIPEDYPVLTVQAIYIEGSRQDKGYGFTYDSNTRTITLAEELPQESAGDVITIQLGQINSDSPETILSRVDIKDAANFTSISDTVNTLNKYMGKGVYDRSIGTVLYASGPLPADGWRDGIGTLKYTPA